MKLAQFRHGSDTAWGVVDVDAGTIQPVVGTILDWGPSLTAHGTPPPPNGEPVVLDDVQLLAPIGPTTTVVGVGMNYWTHLEQLGVTERPATTIGYLKARASIVGPDEDIAYPPITEQLDFEVELVAVIGAPDAGTLARPTDAVLGYTVGNDISARDFMTSQLGGPDLFSMKVSAKASPLGPWITTKDELGPDPLDIEIATRVNGEERQKDRTSKMIFSVDECLAYVLDRIPLEPGDIVFTGTTNGCAAEDGRWLEPGDVVETEIEGIGVLRNTVGPRPTRTG